MRLRSLPMTPEKLRAALAGKPPRQAREPGAPRKPREGTKQEAVLALLRRDEGATIAQICEATGWQGHTVRGFFAGLKKRQGIEVQVLERVRQVGPNKEETLIDAAGGRYEGFRTHYEWNAGLTLRDWRYVVRIANVDVTALTKNASAGADLIDLMVQAIELLPNARVGRPVFYGNRTVRSFLRRQIANKSNVWLNMEEVAGRKVMTFDSVPFKRVDAILNTEARVV